MKTLETKKRKSGPKISNGRLYSKRKHPRFQVDGLACHIADGNLVLDGVVGDISSGGFKMANLPQSFMADRHIYKAVLSGNGHHHPLVVIPCWSEKTANSQVETVGFRIIEASWEWTEYILNTASVLENINSFEA